MREGNTQSVSFREMQQVCTRGMYVQHDVGMWRVAGYFCLEEEESEERWKKGKAAFASTAKGNLERQGGLQYFAREGKASTEGGTEGTSGDPASRQET